MVERVSIRMPDSFISAPFHTPQRLKMEGASQPIHTIPLGVDVEAILAAPMTLAQNDVLYAGRLIKHKNVDVLLRSVSLLKQRFPNVICTVVGDGPENHSLQQLATFLAFDRNVRFQQF